MNCRILIGAHVSAQPIPVRILLVDDPRDEPLAHQAKRSRVVLSPQQVGNDPRLAFQLASRQSNVSLPSIGGNRFGEGKRLKNFRKPLDQLLGEWKTVFISKKSSQRLASPVKDVSGLPSELQGQCGEIRLRKIAQIAGVVPSRLAARTIEEIPRHRQGAARLPQDLDRMDPAGQVQQRPEVKKGARAGRIQHAVVRAADLHPAQRSQVENGKVRKKREVPKPVRHVDSKSDALVDRPDNVLQERVDVLLRIAGGNLNHLDRETIAQRIFEQRQAASLRLRRAERQHPIRASLLR